MACGLCCGLPLLTLLGGVGLAAAVGAVLEVFERFAFVLAAVLAVAVVLLRAATVAGAALMCGTRPDTSARRSSCRG